MPSVKYSMILAIDEEIERLRKIRDLLAGGPLDVADSVSDRFTRKRQLTPEGRARIVEAQRRRWAAIKGTN